MRQSQPVDTIITWLRGHDFGAIADWRVETVNLHSAMEVINPIVWSTMVDDASMRDAALIWGAN